MTALAHVLLFTDDPAGGGVAQYNHALLCALTLRGYRVTCVQTPADNALVRRQAELGVRHAWLDFDTGHDFRRTLTHTADAERVLREHGPDLVLFSNGSPLSYCAAKREHGPDLVLFSNGSPLSHCAAKQVAIRRRTPFVVIEGFAAAYLADKFHERLDELSRHYAAAQAVIAVSHENLQLLHRVFRLPPAWAG